MPVFCGTLRAAPEEFYDLLRGRDVVVVTVPRRAARWRRDAAVGGDDDAWDVAALAALDVPVIQVLCLTTPRKAWAGSLWVYPDNPGGVQRITDFMRSGIEGFAVTGGRGRGHRRLHPAAGPRVQSRGTRQGPAPT